MLEIAGLPFPHKALPPSSHLLIREVFENQVFLYVQVETEHWLVVFKIMLADWRGLKWEYDCCRRTRFPEPVSGSMVVTVMRDW